MSFLRSLMCTILAHQQLQIVIIFRWKNSQWQYNPCGWLRWKSEILEEETSFDPKWRNFFPPDLKNIHQNFHLGSNIDYYYYVIENPKLFTMYSSAGAQKICDFWCSRCGLPRKGILGSRSGGGMATIRTESCIKLSLLTAPILVHHRAFTSTWENYTEFFYGLSLGGQITTHSHFKTYTSTRSRKERRERTR